MEANALPLVDVLETTHFIKREALNMGFDACGIAPAHPLPLTVRNHYLNWLKEGYQGDMHYMERNLELRLDPRELVPDAASVVVVALNYSTQHPTSTPGIARYARRPDYHPLIRERLYTLLKRLNDSDLDLGGRAFSDSAPLAERYWAEQAGLGWVGKNHVLIMPGKGSWFLLGALVINRTLHYDKPMPNRCGSCKKCIEACPGQAIHEGGGLEATRCLSYLTIEKKGEFSAFEARLLNGANTFFGCDRCQEVCPWNRFCQESSDPNFSLLPFLENPDVDAIERMETESFKQTFRGTSLERTGLEALKRNLRCIKKVRPSE